MKQDCNIVHPFNVRCTFKCYNNTAHASGIFTAVFGSNVSLLNYGILLFFPNALLGNRFDCVRLVPPVNWSLLARHGGVMVDDIRRELHMGCSRSESGSTVLSALNQGYLQTYLDWYYLTGSPGYLRSHFREETLLCGYDHIGDYFVAPMWDNKGVFRISKIPFENVVEAFCSKEGWRDCHTFNEHDRSTGFSDELRKPVYRVITDSASSFVLDLALIKQQIDDALCSRCTYSNYIDARLVNWPEAEGVYGLATYGAYLEYLSQCVASGIPVDLRASRQMWEHKAVMVERLIFLRNQGCNIPGDIQQLYEEIAGRLWMTHLKFTTQGVRDGDLRGLGEDMRRFAKTEDLALRALSAIL